MRGLLLSALLVGPQAEAHCPIAIPGVVGTSSVEACATASCDELTVPLPAGTASGDLLLLALYTDGRDAGFDPGAGWTLLTSGGSQRYRHSTYTLTRVVTPNEPSMHLVRLVNIEASGSAATLVAVRARRLVSWGSVGDAGAPYVAPAVVIPDGGLLLEFPVLDTPSTSVAWPDPAGLCHFDEDGRVSAFVSTTEAAGAPRVHDVLPGDLYFTAHTIILGPLFVDAGSADAGSADAGSADAGSADAGSADAGSADAGSADAGSADAGSADAGSADAGSADAGSADAGRVDAGVVDEVRSEAYAYSVAQCGHGAVGQAPLLLMFIATVAAVRRRIRRRASEGTASEQPSFR